MYSSTGENLDLYRAQLFCDILIIRLLHATESPWHPLFLSMK
jgi:hypothetical protein